MAPGKRLPPVFPLVIYNGRRRWSAPRRLRARLAAPGHDSLRRAFTVWIHRVALGRMIPGQDVPRTETLEETEAMLAERVTEWTREWKREGLEQGRLEGQRATVQRLLMRRFGPLPEAALMRLSAADEEVLDQWAERLLDASDLDEVFQAAP